MESKHCPVGQHGVQSACLQFNFLTPIRGVHIMETTVELQNQAVEKKTKKAPKDSLAASASTLDTTESKGLTIKITLEGEAARRVLKCETELRERLSKPDMGRILGQEILAWTDKRWAEIVEENTDMDFFFAQIKKCPDRSKAVKLLKGLSEKLKSENLEDIVVGTPGLLLSNQDSQDFQVG
jgi:hypothetical protein